MTKKYFLVLDTETAGGLGDPMVYDIGLLVIDKQGNIYEEKSYVVQEVFDKKRLMNTAYYKDKIPAYLEQLENGERVKRKWLTIRQEIESILKKYNITELYAYNCGFDKKALKNTNKNLVDDLYGFFFRKLDYSCIWHMACQLICNNRNYKKFCKDYNFISDSGNYLTSAEVVYRYLKNDINFDEKHTGLEDCYIEKDILVKCWSKHKKVDKSIKAGCWKIVQD